jgi:hypothetical protein
MLVSGLAEFASTDFQRFLAYLALAWIGATWRLKIAGVPVTLSPSFAFILIGIAEFSLGEAMLMAIAATLVQCWWRPATKRSRSRTMFNIGAVSIAVMVAYNPTHYFLSLDVRETPTMLLLAALVYFIVNTGLVSAMVALTENTSLTSVWRYLARHTLAYYALGGVIATLTVSVCHMFGWRAGLVVVPLLYLAYHSYRLYLRWKGLMAA